MIGICQFGAGRIGQIHAANVAAHAEAELRYIVDVSADAANAIAGRHGAKIADARQALDDEAIDAVIVASSTDAHADIVKAAARAGKAIFCEKPIDLELARVDDCLAEVEAAGVMMQIGFNRRFDPSFAALHGQLRDGRIGAVELVAITSRDPAPPPIEYIRVSGGLFRDMMIHDLDMARWLVGEDPVEVFAAASCLVDDAIGAAGDVDTAAVVLSFASGALCQISNSRRAVYGYDQRIEVFGAKGMLRAHNRTPTSVELSTEDGIVADKPLYFFLERYAESYKAELDHFIDCVKGEATPLTGPADGRMALVLAEAARTSLANGGPVPVRP
jgi:myo-inositol 2-dehydrogenase/D-chiro-inositol 1-dehydrogenase